MQDQAPAPFNPRDLQKRVQKVAKELDELESSDAPVPRALHDIVQDGMMGLLAELQSQVATLAYYMSGHEDRIADLEEGEGSQLLPEDAEQIGAYIQRCTEIFRELTKKHAEEFPGIESMVDAGENILGFIDQITLPDEPPEEGDEDGGLN